MKKTAQSSPAEVSDAMSDEVVDRTGATPEWMLRLRKHARQLADAGLTREMIDQISAQTALDRA